MSLFPIVSQMWPDIGWRSRIFHIQPLFNVHGIGYLVRVSPKYLQNTCISCERSEWRGYLRHSLVLYV